MAWNTAILRNQMEIGIKGWDSDLSEERSLVMLPYALSNRRDRTLQGQGLKWSSGPGQNLGHSPDAADNRARFCRAYHLWEGSRPDPHWAFVQGRGPVMVQHICAKCNLTDNKSSYIPRTAPVLQLGRHDKFPNSPHLHTAVSQQGQSHLTTSLPINFRIHKCR